MPLSRSVLVVKARPIKIIAMDVDGVLTGGEVIILESGEEVKIWNSKDRLCMASLRDNKLPLRFAWITGRSSNAVTKGALELGIPHVIQKCRDKKAALQEILENSKFHWNEAAYIGDDLLDLPVLRSVGFAACPSDAVFDVRKNVHYVSSVPGGKGVVQDVVEFILRSQKKWDHFLHTFQ
jgi:3-deoxy-D-manno-octulosonate 8-phosphate phosphatase (KDO 8-P phosphatase)